MQLPEGKEVRFCPNCGEPLVPQAVRDKTVIAEFHYWDYEEFSGTAMKRRPQIITGELENIAREFNVKVDVKKAAAQYFAPGRIGWRLPKYSRVGIQVSGERSDDVKSCIGKIFLLYGRPDEVPRAMFGSKRDGKKIIDELLRESNLGKG